MKCLIFLSSVIGYIALLENLKAQSTKKYIIDHNINAIMKNQLVKANSPHKK